MMARYDKRILAVTGSPGEWFVDLRAGWRTDDALAPTHGFGVERKSEIAAYMRDRVARCDCAECREIDESGEDEAA